jgi:hypothetical protein
VGNDCRQCNRQKIRLKHFSKPVYTGFFMPIELFPAYLLTDILLNFEHKLHKVADKVADMDKVILFFLVIAAFLAFLLSFYVYSVVRQVKSCLMK